MEKNVKIDLVTCNERTDTWRLIAIVQGPWIASETTEQMRKLQERLFDYVDAALIGAVAAQYPASRGKSVVIRLDCFDVPRTEVEQFFNRFAEHIRNNAEVQKRITALQNVKNLAFELSWASIPSEPKSGPARPSWLQRLFRK